MKAVSVSCRERERDGTSLLMLTESEFLKLVPTITVALNKNFLRLFIFKLKLLGALFQPSFSPP